MSRHDRPWGFFRVLDETAHYKVKAIAVLAGQRLSLQRHQHRSENWVVVGGQAEVQLGDEQLTLSIGQHLFIPVGAIHRLGNSQEQLLTVIEVQSGDYLGEDDIIRLADDYNRSSS